MTPEKLSTYLLLLLIVFDPVSLVQAQTVLRLQQAFSENRISENANRCMFKDSKGYIWVGTIDGLNRYDGNRFHIFQYDPRDSSSISGNYITTIHEDHRGNIWVGTNKGLNRYDPYIDGFEKFESLQKDPGQVATEYITGIISDHDQELWISAYGGLARYDYTNKRFVPIHVDPVGREGRILQKDVTAICALKGEGFWIGYKDGRLSKYQKKHFRHYPGIGQNISITDLFEDKEDFLWIGADEGIFRYEEQSLQLTKYHHKKSWNIYSMGDKVWMNINFEGIFEWNPQRKKLERISVYVNGQEVFGDIKAFFEDQEGIIWASYHGLYKQDDYENRFPCFRHEPQNANSINEQFVAGIAEDADGNWIVLTANNGLNYYDRAKQQWLNHLTHPWYDNELVKIRSSTLKVAGELAYVFNQQAVFEFNTQTGKLRKFQSDSLVFDFRSSIVLQDPRNIWVSSGNILLLDPQSGHFQKFTPGKSTDANRQYFLYKDSEKQIWALSNNEIFRFDPTDRVFLETYRYGGARDSKFEENIITATRDSQGSFWIGRRNGLEYFNPESGILKHYSIADGLPNNTINSIQIDQHGLLWLGTNNGLSKFDPARESFRNYDRLDGIQDEIFLSNSSFKTPDGRLLFGGVNGVNVFHPDSLLGVNPHPPKLLITDFKIFNESVIPGKNSVLSQPISDTRSIELSYRHASISFELLAIGYSQPQKNQYAYMIEGVDPSWNYVGTGQTASYTGLPRGETLIFKAKAANHDGVWSETPITLSIYIHPPFWKTGWFRVALLLSLISLILLYYQWRVRSIQLQNLRLEKEVRKQTAEIEHQAADLQLANEKLKRKAKIIKEKAQQLDQLNKAQAHFFTSLSHEFRTPLTLLLGNLDALLQSSEPEKVFEKISRRMKMSAQQLLQLINQLMDTAKLESGQYRLRVQEAEIKAQIQGICSTFQVLAEKNDLELQLIFKENQLSRCWYDSDILQKVLNNLLSNAIKFTEKGSITVTVDVIYGTEDQQTLQLCVADSGIGISEEQLPLVFNRFYQVESPLSARKKGTGIGLSLVWQLVHLHKGRITVESETDKGTTFNLWLPVDQTAFTVAERPEVSMGRPISTSEATDFQPVATELTEIEASLNAKENAPLLLVVEDNPEIRSFVVRQLHQQYQIIEAEDGEKALKLAIEQIPDLIVSDVIMPYMNGFELCDKLKTDRRTSHIPIILLTALSEQQQKLEGLKLGADAYLSKPFSREELLLKISNLISFQEKLRKRFLKEYSLHHLPDGLSEMDQNFLENLNRLIEDKLTDENLGIDQLIKYSGVSRTQLFRKLKSLTGMSASEFIRDFRLRKAYQLLNENKLTVSEVIHATGFNSRSYFYNTFKKKFGVAPSRLKKV